MCKLAKFNGEEYICNSTGDRCLYLIPTDNCKYIEKESNDSKCENCKSFYMENNKRCCKRKPLTFIDNEFKKSKFINEKTVCCGAFHKA